MSIAIEMMELLNKMLYIQEMKYYKVDKMNELEYECVCVHITLGSFIYK